MESEIKNLVSLLKQTFEKGAWHGPSVLESLEGVDEAQAFKRLGHTHSIVELVGHMAAWKTYTARKLKGDVAYKVTDEMNFPALDSLHEGMKRLHESHAALVSAVETFPAHKLSEPFPGSTTPYTFYSLIHGIIHHDLYHAGQIMLIKKATTEQTF